MRSKTFLVPQFLPSKHEPAHVKITEQRADRRSLRRPSTFVPIARIPTPLSVLILLFDRRHQPHLDQVKHGAIDNPARHRLQKLGMRKKIEIAGKICINDLTMSIVDQLMDVSHCVQCAAVAPVGILFRL